MNESKNPRRRIVKEAKRDNTNNAKDQLHRDRIDTMFHFLVWYLTFKKGLTCLIDISHKPNKNGFFYRVFEVRCGDQVIETIDRKENVKLRRRKLL